MVLAMLFSHSSLLAFAQEIEAENGTIPVRIRIEVPHDFTSSVSLLYEGKDTEGFSVTLSDAEEYTTVINLMPGIYTYKESNVAAGYSASLPKSFYLNGSDNNTFLLPVVINSSDAENTEDYVNVLATVEFVDDIECHENILLHYSGTAGNAIVFELSEANNYTTDISIPQDLYTLKEVEISGEPDKFYCDTLYSINTEGLNRENHYALKAKVMKYTEDLRQEKERKQEEKTIEYGDLILTAQVPEHTGFSGSIFVSYRGENSTKKFETELCKENNYFSNVELPVDKYIFVYSVSYDSNEYTFSAQPGFTIKKNDLIPITVYMLKDGVVVEQDQPESVSDNGDEQAETDEDAEKNPASVIFMLLLILSVIVFLNRQRIGGYMEKVKEKPITATEKDIKSAESDENGDKLNEDAVEEDETKQDYDEKDRQESKEDIK